MGSDTITWPPEFSDFKKLDTILKCGICYEYMTNCMITSCSHNYCSLCIRKFMQYKNQCPTCFENIFEINLRNNRPLDEVILIYVKLRDKLLRALRLASVPIPVKDPEPTQTPVASKNDVLPKTPTSANKQTSLQLPKNESKTKEKKLSGSSNKTAEEDVILNGVKIPGIFNAPKVFPKQRKPEELTLCPVCQVDVPTKNINLHLDSCLALDNESKPKRIQPKRSPLPKRLYYLMPDKALKKTLKEYGLHTNGDRKALIARIQRYTVIHNSENDSSNPRPVSELIQQLEREEREEKPNPLMKAIHTLRVTVDRKADPETIEKANKAYCEENKESFKKLIEAMRAREGKNIKPLKPPNRIYSDDEDENRQSANLYETEDNELEMKEGTSNVDKQNEGNMSHFDANEPSTSNVNKRPPRDESENHSLYSQVTIYGSDSESDADIFVDEQKKNPKVDHGHNIDWEKTKLNEDSDSEVNTNKEAIIDADTNLDASSCTLPPQEIEEGKSVVNDDSSDDSSINSIFNSSKISDKNFTPTPKKITCEKENLEKAKTETPLCIGSGRKRRLKRKSSKKLNMEDVFDKCFEQYTGDKVTEEEDLDSSKEDISDATDLSSIPEPDNKTPRRSRRRNEKQICHTEPRQSRRTKRFRKDLSPAF